MAPHHPASTMPGMAKQKAGATPDRRRKAPAAVDQPRAGKVASAEKAPTVRERIERFGGLETILDALANGRTMTATAHEIGISVGNLSGWLAEDQERSARAREARAFAARLWDDEAERVIKEAPDAFELHRAKELAHHYRWRASKIAPKDYGDKVLNEHTGADGGAIEVRSTVTFVRPSQGQQ